MESTSKTSKYTINKLQIFIGFAGLIFGTLVYLIDRHPDQTYFIQIIGLSLHTLPNIFGYFGNNLPAFIHVFSFILITGGLLSTKKYTLTICLGWFLIDCVFELGQKYPSLSSSVIPDWFNGIPFLENTKYFFLQGTFDILDLIAICFGTVIAYFVLQTTNRNQCTICHETKFGFS